MWSTNDDSASTLDDTPATVDVAANDTGLQGNLDPATAFTPGDDIHCHIGLA